jgi:hypothetical protein
MYRFRLSVARGKPQYPSGRQANSVADWGRYRWRDEGASPEGAVTEKRREVSTPSMQTIVQEAIQTRKMPNVRVGVQWSKMLGQNAGVAQFLGYEIGLPYLDPAKLAPHIWGRLERLLIDHWFAPPKGPTDPHLPGKWALAAHLAPSMVYCTLILQSQLPRHRWNSQSANVQDSSPDPSSPRIAL